MINLSKGDSLDLYVNAPSLKVAGVGLSWDAKSSQASTLGKLFGATDAEYDLDAVAFVLGASGRLLSDRYFVFFNNLSSPEGAVRSAGDNRTGAGDGDDETITIEFDKLPTAAQTVAIWVTLYKAHERKQSFAEVENAVVRLYDQQTNEEQLRYELSGHSAASVTALEFCHLVRTGQGWTFKAVGEGHPIEIGEVLARYS